MNHDTAPVGLVSCCLPLHKVRRFYLLSTFSFSFCNCFLACLINSHLLCLSVHCTPHSCHSELRSVYRPTRRHTHTHTHTLRCSLILEHYIRLLMHNHHCHIYSDCLMFSNFRHVRMCPLYLPSTSKSGLT